MNRHALLALALAVLALLVATACGSPPEQTPVHAAAPREWDPLPDPPFEPRAHAVGVWTGAELLIVGGDAFLCPPTADCTAPEDPPFASGAALDPETREWRRIADAPRGFTSASAVAAGGAAYFLAPLSPEGGHALLRYAVDDDAWATVPVPRTVAESSGWALVASGERVVAYSTTHELGTAADLVYDPATGEWAELPVAPLGPAFDRTMVAAGADLYLFDHELVPNPGSERPSLTRVARLDWTTSTWERLPDGDVLYAGPWLATATGLVNPSLGAADGGETNGWGRSYPHGGRLATATATWHELPPAPRDEFSAGAFTARSALVYGTRGLVLDVDRAEWLDLPAIPGDVHPTVSRNVFNAGAAVVTVGGERWADGATGEVVEDAWMLDLGS